LGALLERSQGQFPNDERMDHNAPLGKVLTQFLVFRTEMINPNGSICENHALPTLRRGMFFNSGIVPPRAANLRALSRSIRALRASRTNTVFSVTPVNSWAMRTSSS